MNTYTFLVRNDVLIHADNESDAWDLLEKENPDYIDAEIISVH